MNEKEINLIESELSTRERERTEIIENLYRLYHKFLQDSKACHTEALAEVSLNDRDFSFATQTQNDKYQGKIVWNRISNELSFSYDEVGHYILDSMFMIASQNELSIKYLLSVLNSNISKHWIKHNAATLGDGVYGAKIYIEKLPIPKIDSKNQTIVNQIIALVDEILNLKANCHSEPALAGEESLSKESRDSQRDVSSICPQHDKISDTSKLESQIDKLVYKLYNLNEEEIKIINK
ncbi:TaqI-like C-terminal specificity domain-containing protein [Helicobacter muridarum]|uniref:TaqI-like C-terminal specificity domain-containing protein n=1 Tax=Helicobacter muridarum TaxID=216 RepID=UPI001FD2FA3A|nr:TaqI-like C-terminal specificity domain-containing protein [Helicobacter muridarum]